GYILESAYEMHLPARLKEAFSEIVKSVSDSEHKELKPSEIYRLFVEHFVENTSRLDVSQVRFRQQEKITATVSILDAEGKSREICAEGNGRLDAVSNALKNYLGIPYLMNGYEQHALSAGSSSKAITYLSIENGGKSYWGAGIHDDGTTASVNALCAAINNLLSDRKKG
ncbi:MAG: alpha-isopropylmalate synthase regulatory domain-containing protein, partial [Christensenellaceae bacterium]